MTRKAPTLGEFEKAGMGMGMLAEKLQVDGAEAFVQSWRDLLQAIESKSAALRGRNL
jgi:transaldolase